MPCNMPSKGDRVELIVVNGENTLRDLLAKALTVARKVDFAKIESLLELEESFLLYSHLLNGELASVCIENPSGKILGANALQLIREHLDDKPLTGYIEVSRISKTAFELDLESEPDAKLLNPTPLETLLAGELLAKEEGKEGAKPGETGQVEEGVPVLSEKLGNLSLIDEIELATTMVYLLTKSEIISYSRDLKNLLREALERSSGDAEAFYRVAVELGNGEAYNAFYHAGKLCSVIHVLPEGFRARFISHMTEKDFEQLLEENKGRVKRAILYRVLCPECAEVVLKGCSGKPSEPHGNDREEEKREKEVRRRFRLLRFLRRT